jgi:quercetin dioxygenase-like cupin family protein
MPNPPSASVIPWNSPESPNEHTIRNLLAQENLEPYAWGNSPGDVYASHTHSYHKVIYVVEGSITFGLPGENRQVTLEAGDRLELPAGTSHNAVVGPLGVHCLEAHR